MKNENIKNIDKLFSVCYNIFRKFQFFCKKV